MRLLDAPDVLRRAGCPVVVLPGFERRGADLARIDAIVEHCTVTPASMAQAAVAGILRDGRVDLRGPLSQLGHANDDIGTWWCVASGRASHNGYGRFGNQSIGVEKFHPNTAVVPYRGMESWLRGSAALSKHYGVPVLHVQGHKETDPRRKSDPVGVAMAAFRVAVARLQVADIIEEDWLMALSGDEQQELFDKVRDLHRWHLHGVPEYGVPSILSATAQDHFELHGLPAGPDGKGKPGLRRKMTDLRDSLARLVRTEVTPRLPEPPDA